jgi:hypothetical protein|tara:strand:- start:798 stop:1979 length:1182 start_codon:yes stop_codon:yes gene_type:complete
MKINSPLYLSIFYGILFLSSGGQSQSFDQVYSENLNCINPSWAYDSRTFTVEKVEKEEKYKLMLGRVSDKGIGSPLMPVFKTEKKRGKKKKEKKERNAGWINLDERAVYFMAVEGEKNQYMKQIGIWANIDEIDRDRHIKFYKSRLFQKTTDTDRKTLLNSQSRYFTSIKDGGFYFINLSNHNKILRAALPEKKILPIKGFNAIGNIGISSLSASPDGTKLLVVHYDNTLTEIYDLEIELNRNTVVSQNTVDKPDEELNFFAGIRYPDKNISKYALMGASEIMSQNFVCKVFIVQDNHTLASFDGYWLSKEFDLYTKPVGQWIPSTGLFYYLKKAEQGGGTLYFWDGQNEINANLEISNIRDFKFSPDGKYLIAATLGGILDSTPKLIIYKVN